MDNHFITDNHTLSPRWHRAFSEACVLLGTEGELQLDPDCRYWIVASDQMDWPQLVRSLASQGSQVVLLTLQADRDELLTALACGARGYVEAFANPKILKQVANSLAAGALWLPADAVAELAGSLQHSLAMRPASHKANPLTGLTARELEVVAVLSEGRTNKEIARHLAISERTVKEHLGTVFQKLQVKDRLQLALLFNQTRHSQSQP